MITGTKTAKRTSFRDGCSAIVTEHMDFGGSSHSGFATTPFIDTLIAWWGSCRFIAAFGQGCYTTLQTLRGNTRLPPDFARGFS